MGRAGSTRHRQVTMLRSGRGQCRLRSWRRGAHKVSLLCRPEPAMAVSLYDGIWGLEQECASPQQTSSQTRSAPPFEKIQLAVINSPAADSRNCSPMLQEIHGMLAKGTPLLAASNTLEVWKGLPITPWNSALRVSVQFKTYDNSSLTLTDRG